MIQDQREGNVAPRDAHSVHVTFDAQGIAREVCQNLEASLGPQHRGVWNALLQTTVENNERTPRPVLSSTVQRA